MRKTTPEMRAEIVRKDADGIPKKDIAAQYNLNYQTVCRIVHKGSIPEEIESARKTAEALQELEDRFPGILARIRDGGINFKLKTVVEITEF